MDVGDSEYIGVGVADGAYWADGDERGDGGYHGCEKNCLDDSLYFHIH